MIDLLTIAIRALDPVPAIKDIPRSTILSITQHKFQRKSDQIKYGVARGIQAYFISDINKIISVGQRHIDEILAVCWYFGFDRNEIEILHQQIGEKLGQEGVVRNEMMKTLLKRGWIRIRQYNETWHLEAWKLDKKTITNVNSWVYQMLINGLIDENTDFIMTTLNDNVTYASAIGDR